MSTRKGYAGSATLDGVSGAYSGRFPKSASGFRQRGFHFLAATLVGNLRGAGEDLSKPAKSALATLEAQRETIVRNFICE